MQHELFVIWMMELMENNSQVLFDCLFSSNWFGTVWNVCACVKLFMIRVKFGLKTFHLRHMFILLVSPLISFQIFSQTCFQTSSSHWRHASNRIWDELHASPCFMWKLLQQDWRRQERRSVCMFHNRRQGNTRRAAFFFCAVLKCGSLLAVSCLFLLNYLCHFIPAPVRMYSLSTCLNPSVLQSQKCFHPLLCVVGKESETMRDPDSLYRRNVPGYSNLELISGTKIGIGWSPVLEGQNNTRSYWEEKARILDLSRSWWLKTSVETDITSRSFPSSSSDFMFPVWNPLLGLNAGGFVIPDDWSNCYLPDWCWVMLTVVDEDTAPETAEAALTTRKQALRWFMESQRPADHMITGCC